MSELVDFHSLFTQLQSRYPTSSLTAELVATQAESFVVRAVIQVGGVTLATSMASETTVEAAEDQARLRVLSLLGIAATVAPRASGLPPINFEVPTRPHSFDSSLPDSNSVDSKPVLSPPVPLPTPSPLPKFEESFQPSIAKGAIEPPPTSGSLFEPSFEVADDDFLPPEDLYESKDSLPEAELPTFEPLPPVDSVIKVDTAATSKPRRTKKEPPRTEEPLDLSSLIALTDVEMERTGLSKKRGQAYLVETFGKQTRADLDEEQLLDFLNYLKALPSRYQTM